jgi:hypothetical protein
MPASTRATHATPLAHAVFFHRRGKIRDWIFQDQRYRASRSRPIILWNTVYLGLAAENCARGESFPPSFLPMSHRSGGSISPSTATTVWPVDPHSQPSGPPKSARLVFLDTD